MRLDPGVLVRGVGRRREDRDLAGVADLLGDQVDLDLRDARCVGRLDEDVAAVGAGVGVVRDDLDARVAGLADRVAQRGRVVRRDGDRADTLLGQRVDVADLPVGRTGGGADLGVGAVELVDRVGAALVGGVEVGVAEVLRQEGDGQVARVALDALAPLVARGRGAACEHRDADRQHGDGAELGRA